MTKINMSMHIVMLFAVWTVGLLFGAAGRVNAQSAVRLGGPNDQQTEKLRNLYGAVCDGHFLSGNDTRCSGDIFRADEYTALNTARSFGELVKLNAALVALNKSMDRLNATTSETKTVLGTQVQAFNNDLRAYIEKRFQDLPNDILQSAAIQSLKKSLTDYVDQKLQNPAKPTQ